MYKLPQDFSGAFFVGERLELICFSINQMTLHFSNDIAITLEGSFSFCCSAQQPVLENFPVTSSGIMSLLDKKVVDVFCNEESLLRLIFEQGYVFECYDSSPNYESYKIRYKNTEIIV
jgi:hypothetical protein